ncbi:hypothetical protein, partial [Bordetella pertussis]|uniref:hypothetical protein n=1 Tax=Bordetella pertussis TaxID=520 RepID=UPI003670E425
MHEPTMSKRRLVLKMLGGAPMLPLGAVGAATLLAGCRAGADDAVLPGQQPLRHEGFQGRDRAAQQSGAERADQRPRPRR